MKEATWIVTICGRSFQDDYDIKIKAKTSKEAGELALEQEPGKSLGGIRLARKSKKKVK